MKLLFSISWFILVVAPPTSVFAMVATRKEINKHAKENKTSDGIVPNTEPPVDNNHNFVPVIEHPVDGTSDVTSNGTSDGLISVNEPSIAGTSDGFVPVIEHPVDGTSDGTSNGFVPVKEPPIDETSDGTSDKTSNGTNNGTSDGFFPVIEPPVDDGISPFTSTDGGDISAPRKLSKSSKKVQHHEALCTLSLFADSLFMYANRCFTDIMMTIASCDDKDDTCYISERLPLLPQEQEENQEEEQCFVGGLFPAKNNISYNPSTGDCEFLYVDLTDDPCNLYKGDTGTGSLGLKARINVKNNPDVMFIQFTKDKGLTFYNAGDERFAVRSPTHNDARYLRQEGETKPVLSMMPHPFASGHRRLYSRVALKNDTPYEVISARIEYCACAKDENTFIASGGTWTADSYRGGCLVTEIHSTLIIDGREEQCVGYGSRSGAVYSEFYIMWIDGNCCLRSSAQDSDKCIRQFGDGNCNPSSVKDTGKPDCGNDDCADPVWGDGCEACMCFNNGNAAWCDGLRGDHYDKYFEEHGENPWGDTNVRNRKCNTEFIEENASLNYCHKSWQCAKGLTCYSGGDQTNNMCGT